MKRREISVVSLSFHEKSVEEIERVVEEEARKGCDLILLPETWTGSEAETLEKGTTADFQRIAAQYGVYIVNSVYLQMERYPRINSAVLIDRKGRIYGIYHKMYPYWSEYDHERGVCLGEDISVFETDFGRVGIAICFDANFFPVWQSFAQQRADLVLFSSAYSSGTTLQGYALCFNYAVISATLCGDCVAYDINGEELYYKKGGADEILVSRITLNTNRAVFHQNFNMEKREALLASHAGKVTLTREMPREEWFILQGSDTVQIKTLAQAYGMEMLPDYRQRSMEAMDRLRAEQIRARL